MVALLRDNPTQSFRPAPDLSDADTRARLTGSALEAFLRLMEEWRMSSKQATSLLGESSERTWFRIKSRDWKGPLSQDGITRVSALVGLYKGLQLLFSEPLSNEWIRLPNKDAPFDGVAPVEYMIKGGIPAFLLTRQYIDALRGGL